MLQHRYMYRLPDGRIVGNMHDTPCDPESAWMDWQGGKTLEAAIREGIGDTSFFEAASLCEEHREAVKQLQAEIAAERARHAAELRLQAAQEALEAFKLTENRLFAKRHGHKTGEEYDRAFARTQKRLKPEYDRLVAAVEAARKSLQNGGME
jgi:hypothetical protein